MSALGDGIEVMFRFIGAVLFISVPLALWKLVDIGLWIYRHVTIGIAP